MPRILSPQLGLFEDLAIQFPSTRYQGSKIKLTDWIWEKLSGCDFLTCLDAFGGTGAIAHRFKREGKEVVYNDLLKFNYIFGLALIENSQVQLSPEDVNWILTKHAKIVYPSFVQDSFSGIYFTDEENAWIDQVITNIRHLNDPYKHALSFFALCQACIIKRPFNLFHRKNLYLRLAEVERSFGNKTSWDKPFDEWFRVFVAEANGAVFDNGMRNRSLNCNALEVPDQIDLVYIDTPYISKRGVGVDYLSFYHFLEGLANYDEWKNRIDWSSKHLRMKLDGNEWAEKGKICSAMDLIFRHFQDSIIVVSYRSDGIPSEEDISTTLNKYKKNIQISKYENYKYVLSKNSETHELLFIGT